MGRRGASLAVFAVLLVALAVALYLANRPPALEVRAQHSIEFFHVADKDGLPQHETLHELEPPAEENPSELAARYYMDADSVFCGEGVCRIDTVRLFWTELGFYHGYFLEEGTRLEKFDGLDFEQEDYLKLDRVLGDRESSLATLHMTELVKKPAGGNTVDALTGATVFIPKDDYVEGAIWTSFTLWHYLYGEVAGIIRNITGEQLTEQQLLDYLHRANPDYPVFALEQLAKKATVSEQGLEEVLDIAPGSVEALHPSLMQFAESLEGERYYRACGRYLASDSDPLVDLVLDSLSARGGSVSAWFIESLVGRLARFQSFRQVQSVLEYLEQQNQLGLLTTGQVEALLENENFVIARNAFWVLSRNPVSDNVSIQLSRFRERNQNRL